jgi:hypothetical protein
MIRPGDMNFPEEEFTDLFVNRCYAMTRRLAISVTND